MIEQSYVGRCLITLEERLLTLAGKEAVTLRIAGPDAIKAAHFDQSDLVKAELLGKLEALTMERELAKKRSSLLAKGSQTIQAVMQSLAPDAVAVIYDLMIDEGTNARVRLACAQAILEGGKGVVLNPDELSTLTTDELERKARTILESSAAQGSPAQKVKVLAPDA